MDLTSTSQEGLRLAFATSSKNMIHDTLKKKEKKASQREIINPTCSLRFDTARRIMDLSVD